METTPPSPFDIPPAIEKRIPSWAMDLAIRSVNRWPGRIALALTRQLRRIELFDRSMTVAAQFFTSVFPLLILMGIWLGSRESGKIADSLDTPSSTQPVIEEAMTGASSGTVGLIGVLFVLVSGTSLSRALTRTYAVIWSLPRPKNRVGSVWRWLAVLTTLALFLVVSPVLAVVTKGIPPSGGLWTILGLAGSYIALATFVPWVLLERRVPARQLMVGAALFSVLMILARPITQIYLPNALETSAEHYGSIGVAFTYISYLYALSFVFLGTAAIGQVLASDEGGFARWIRGEGVPSIQEQQGGVTYVEET